MPKADQLIRTKIHLPLNRSGLVPRPRLQEQMTQGLRGPLTLVTAPAGFGKTTLVASYVSGCGMPAAWLSLDKDDNQPGRFLNYLVAALREADPAIGSEAAQLLAAQQAPPDAVLTSLVNELDAAGRESILVLDDYQFISQPAVHEAVAFMLEHCPITLHLVIASRSDPPLPLARLRAHGQAVELRAADLRFTEPEAVQFLNDVMGLQLDAAAVELLEDRTEGWIAGLQMAALSMRGREDLDNFIRAFAGTHRFIMDFMLEEVLAREPEEVQAFLLRTAILTRLTGPLCDAVTGASGGQEMLERLERRNLFVVPLDDERRWYRYHHLFADLLQARLHQQEPELVDPLLSRAAEWCERDGQIPDAVGYVLATRDYARAGDLVARYWGSFAGDGAVDLVWSWLKALPEDTVRLSAPLSVAYCWLLWLTPLMEPIEAHLIDAERALSLRVAPAAPSAADDLYLPLPAMIATLRSIVARYQHDNASACVHAERALTLLPENLPAQVDAQLRGLVFVALSSAYDAAGDLERAVSAYAENVHWSCLGRAATGVAGITYRMVGALRLLGRLREADAACRDALDFLQAQGMDHLPAVGVLHVTMSEILVERNDLQSADAHLSQGIQLGRWSGRLDAAKNAAYALSRLRLARGDDNGALAAVQEAEAAHWGSLPPLAMAGLLAIRARVLVWQGALDEAARCVEEAVRLSGEDLGQTRGNVNLAVSRLASARCTPGEAVEELTTSLADAEERGWLGAAIELYVLRSLARVRQGNPREAEADLERALVMGEREGYVRIFLDEGQPMQMLIAQWLAHAGASPLREYAIRLLSFFDAEVSEGIKKQEKTSPTGNLVEPLSQRELEVLHLIATGASNQEVARQLIVSTGTVKAHTASIYRKLDVANRTEAVARARQLGILP